MLRMVLSSFLGKFLKKINGRCLFFRYLCRDCFFSAKAYIGNRTFEVFLMRVFLSAALVVFAGCFSGCGLLISTGISAGGVLAGDEIKGLKQRLFPGEETPQLPLIACIVPEVRPHPVVGEEQAKQMKGNITYHGSDVREAAKFGAIDNLNGIPVRIKKVRGQNMWTWRIMDVCERIRDDVFEGDVYRVTTIDGRLIEEFQYRVPK